MRIYKFIFLFLSFIILIASHNSVLAQNLEPLQFYELNTEDGLSSNFVNDINQDPLGFIWIATNDGLNRYNGTDFKTYKSGNPNYNLSNNYVQSMEVVGTKIYIGTDGGLSVYDLKNESMTIYNEDKDSLMGNSISAIRKLEGDRIALGIYRSGLQWLTISNSEDVFNDNAELNKKLSSKEISSIIQRDNKLFVGTFDHGLNLIDLDNNTVESNVYNIGAINNLYKDSADNIWIGTRDGLKLINTNNEIIHINKANDPKKGLSDNDILCFQEDEYGYMWIGTRNGGLNLLKIDSARDNQNFEIEWYLPSEDDNSINNRTVSSLFLDSDKNMWIGTSTGINLAQTSGELIQFRKHKNSTSQSLSHDRVGALAISKSNGLWIGTDGGGLDYFDPDNQRFKHFSKNSSKNSLSSNYILSLLEDSQKRLWIGTFRGGINLFENGQFQNYLQGFPADGSDVRVIFEDRNNRIWVGTNRGGLFWFDENIGDFKNVTALEKLDIRDISEDENGNLWLATYGSGLKKYNPKTNETISYALNYGLDFPSDIIFSVLYLGEGQLLAGTRYEGLVHLNIENNSFDRVTEVDGLSNNSVVGMMKEDDQYVWLSTFSGINRYNIKNQEIVNISTLNNIQPGEFNIGAITKSEDGIIYIGGNKGLNFFDPSEIQQNEKSRPIYFENLKILNKKVPVQNSPDAVLNSSLFYKNDITLAYNENSFSVDFHSLNFPFARNTDFVYKLEGYSDIWIEANGANTANFTKVPPGDYKLVVKNKSGLNSISKAQLAITITPPFWSTWPAYLLYLVSILLIIYLISSYYSERLKLKNSIVLEQKRYQLEHQLNEERLRFFTGFSHELKTPLTLILAPIENLLEKVKKKESRDDLKFIRRNAKSLQQAINKLLEFRKSEEGLSQLNCSNHDLKDYLKSWLKNYQPLAKEKNIEIQLNYKTKQRKLNCDIDKIGVIINNILSNALKYSNKNSEVNIEVYFEDATLKIEVINQGEGISSEEINHIFEWYYRADHQQKTGTGIGLALSKSFAELHEGTIEVISTPGSKTSFTLCLPEKLLITENQNSADKQEEYKAEEIIADNGVFEPKISEHQKSLSADSNRNIMLIIDDNPEIRLFLENLFKDDYDLLFAEDGQEGINKAAKYVPDVIISDVMMPVKNGIDLCTDLKTDNVTSHIPVILLTAKANIESVSSGYQEGADLYITKPFKPKVLKLQVKSLLTNREKLRVHFSQSQETESFVGQEKNSKLIDTEKQFLQQIEEIILDPDHLKKVNTEFLAKELGMSRTPLYRKIKALTGFNINELIRDIRIRKAADLIYRENYSVTEASYAVGFSSIKYFRKIFKEKYGSNPSEFKTGTIHRT
ncbi:two-component regulator propeller domain-containing protein [Zunongwangia endophytica]|uniref:histidine kinase n=1 Tax=Zunongwangia endophytica TaxID=1808945 RepID=A0ABV8H523_9FLAO|nr:two-component regulator propeller domain-containing protein [Zunongwangia endophytica]MDN3595520.1 two-component regulator propeller domain-containing protein [Zunongwangia endophytica]